MNVDSDIESCTRCRREQAKTNLDKIDGVVWTTSIYVPIESVREIE